MSTTFWPGTNVVKSQGNTFDWDTGQPSIFMSVRGVVANANGESASQVAARAVNRHERETGRSRGTIFGLSRASDKVAEEFQRQIALHKRRAPGHYRG